MPARSSRWNLWVASEFAAAPPAGPLTSVNGVSARHGWESMSENSKLRSSRRESAHRFEALGGKWSGLTSAATRFRGSLDLRRADPHWGHEPSRSAGLRPGAAQLIASAPGRRPALRFMGRIPENSKLRSSRGESAHCFKAHGESGADSRPLLSRPLLRGSGGEDATH